MEKIKQPIAALYKRMVSFFRKEPLYINVAKHKELLKRGLIPLYYFNIIEDGKTALYFNELKGGIKL